MPTLSLHPSAAPPAARALGHRSLWSLEALSGTELRLLLDTARRIERAARAGAPCRALRGKNIARLEAGHAADGGGEFDAAATALGAQVTRIGPSESGLAAVADVPRTARLLGRLYDAIDAGGLHAPELIALEREAGVPIFNGLADAAHPLRLLSVLVELPSLSGRELAGLPVAFEGTAPAARSLQKAAALAGIDVRSGEAAHYVVGSDGARRAGDMRADPRRAAEALRYVLQALLVCSIV